MSVYDLVKCPYCGEEYDMSKYDFDGSDEIDIECEDCGKEFEAIREWYPSFSTKSITFSDCQICGKTERDEDLYISGDKEVCQPCFYKMELEKIKK